MKMEVVSCAGFVILFFSPLFLFDVGFQLSFASVFGILLLSDRLRNSLKNGLSQTQSTA